MSRRELAAGGVVFRQDPRGPRILLIKDRFGCWALPKGRLDAGEAPEQAALREIAEETGMSGSVLGSLATVTYSCWDDAGEEIVKTVSYFLVEAHSGEPFARTSEVVEVGWFSPEEALRLSDYPNNQEVLERARKALLDRGCGPPKSTS